MFSFEWLGRVDYQKALDIQLQRHETVAGGEDGVVLACEHSNVVTFGHRARASSELLHGEQFFADKAYQLVPTDRGGMATIHNHGQLVIYPILPIRRLQMGVRDLVCALECSTIELLAQNGIISRGTETAPGVFTEGGKIAFVGLRIKNGVSYHGISINVANDLEIFSSIRPCGLLMQSMDSMENHSAGAPLQTLAREWAEIFENQVATKSPGLDPCELGV